MTPIERKTAFKSQASLDRLTLAGAAYSICGVTWEHLSLGLAELRPMSTEVKEKFAAYIGRSVEDVFGSSEAEHAA